MGVETVRSVEQIACRDVRPHLTLLLDIDPEIGVERALKRNQTQTRDESRMEHEDAAFFHRVRSGYLNLAAEDPNRIKIVDAQGSVTETEIAIRALVTALLSSAR